MKSMAYLVEPILERAYLFSNHLVVFSGGIQSAHFLPLFQHFSLRSRNLAVQFLDFASILLFSTADI